LQAKRTTDEHQNDVVEYVDKRNHTVCKKVQYKTDQGNKLMQAPTTSMMTLEIWW